MLSTSGRAYSDLGHEVDAGKGLKTIVLDTDTSWIGRKISRLLFYYYEPLSGQGDLLTHVRARGSIDPCQGKGIYGPMPKPQNWVKFHPPPSP